MKTKATYLLFSTALAGVLLFNHLFAGTQAPSDWYAVLDEVQQASHQDAGGRTRANAILGDVLKAVKNGLTSHASTGRVAETPPVGADLEAAAAQAAYSALAVLYPQNLPALDDRLRGALSQCVGSASAIAAGRQWGEQVAQANLAAHGDDVFLNTGSFAAKAQPPAEPQRLPEAKAEDGAIPPGRYRFSIMAGEPGARGYVDGLGRAARFDNPGGITVDRVGNVYVSEQEQGTIRKISSGGLVSTLAGAVGQRGSQDGTGDIARFNVPRGLAMDGAGNIFVADSGNHTIRKINPLGAVTTFAGSLGVSGVVDGNRETARLHAPRYVAADSAGNVFVAEEDRIRKITPEGTVSTLTVKIPEYGYGYQMTFSNSAGYNPPPWPSQICADHSGNLYAIYSDFWEYAWVVKLTPREAGEYVAQVLQPPSSNTSPPWATALAVDGNDNLYVQFLADFICKFSPDGTGEVYAAAGKEDQYGRKDLAADESGNLFWLPGYIGDWPGTDYTVRAATFEATTTGPIITKEPIGRNKYVGDAVQFTVGAVGTPAPTYQWYLNSTPISGADKAMLDLPAVKMTDAGIYHVVVSDSGGSVTSGRVNLIVYERLPSSTISPTAPAPGSGGVTSGGGSFDAASSLALLMLLATAAIRRRTSQ